MDTEIPTTLESVALFDRDDLNLTVEEHQALQHIGVHTLGDARQMIERGAGVLANELSPHLRNAEDLAQRIESLVLRFTSALDLLTGQAGAMDGMVSAESRDVSLIPIHYQRRTAELSRRLAQVDEEIDEESQNAAALTTRLTQLGERRDDLKTQLDALMHEIAELPSHEVGGGGEYGYGDLVLRKLAGIGQRSLELLTEAGYATVHELERDIDNDPEDWWRTKPGLTSEVAKQAAAAVAALAKAWDPTS